MFCSLQLIGKLEEKCSSLPPNYKKALSAGADDIIHSTLRDVGIFYDDGTMGATSLLTAWTPLGVLFRGEGRMGQEMENKAYLLGLKYFNPFGFVSGCAHLCFYFSDRKFVRILMHFWYLTSAWLPEDLELPGTRMFKVSDDNEEPERLLGAIYE